MSATIITNASAGVFGQNAGKSIAFEGNKLGWLNVDGWDQSLSAMVAITAITEQRRVNAQIVHYFGNSVYADVFGDRISQLSLSGVAMAAPCGASLTESGIYAIRNWYESNRLSVRSHPIRITLCAQPLHAYLLEMELSTADVEAHVQRFRLALVVPPPPVTVTVGGGAKTSDYGTDENAFSGSLPDYSRDHIHTYR